MRLAAELHVGAVQHGGGDDLALLLGVDGDAALALAGEDGLHLAHVGGIERHVQRVDEILAQVGDQAAQRIGEARPRRDQHLGDAELARQRHRVQRPGAAEGEQREVARIEAARQRHHADGAGHVRVAEPDDGRRRRIDVDAQRPGELVGEDLAHLRHRHRPRHGQQPLRVQPAQHQVGVGDGGLGAAAAVADGPRIGARRLRPDLQHAGRVDRGDRAAAGADALHVHHRHVDRQAVVDGELGRHLRHAAVDQRHVGGGAAHVVGDGVAHARLRQRRRRRHHARGRARHDGLGRLARHHAGRHGAAVAVHDQQVVLEALRAPARPAGAARSGRGSAARPRSPTPWCRARTRGTPTAARARA